ncbi:MAG: rhamnogalacturonan acetylesterase [Lachnospiraceae bacterium]|nr:rhamnogalacturonan acetylesterase [Lachnospiraceae bacterium]
MNPLEYGIKLQTYPQEARGWFEGVYYPREARIQKMTAADQAAYLSETESGALRIASKLWTETEVTGFGIYPYVNSPVFSLQTGLTDGEFTITFVNPEKEEIPVNCYADEVLMIRDLCIAPGEVRKVSFINCSIHEVTSLRFFCSDTAEQEADAKVRHLYVSDISYRALPEGAAAAIAAGTAGAADGAGAADEAAAAGINMDKPTIFLASDSTVQTYEPFYYPQTGWGQVFYEYVCPQEKVQDRQSEDRIYPQCHVYERETISVENRSIGARSARSFIDEGKWNALLKRAKAGDYVLLQWAHNDATAVRPNRYVCPADFDGFLMKYITSCKSRGIHPILVTPVSRRNCDEHDGEFVLSFGEYRDEMVRVAEREHIPCVDLCVMSNDYLKQIGSEEAKSLYLWCPAGAYPEGAYADGVSDNTHLQEYGAKIYARMIAKTLLEMEGFAEVDALKPYLNADKVPEKKEITVEEKPVNREVPTGFALQELQVQNKVANFLLIWNDVEGAVSYNVYRKGSVDFQFFPLRTVSAQEKKTAAVLPFTIPAADVYQVKVTAVFADGKESEPSRIIEFRA